MQNKSYVQKKFIKNCICARVCHFKSVYQSSGLTLHFLLAYLLPLQNVKYVLILCYMKLRTFNITVISCNVYQTCRSVCRWVVPPSTSFCRPMLFLRFTGIYVSLCAVYQLASTSYRLVLSPILTNRRTRSVFLFVCLFAFTRH